MARDRNWRSHSQHRQDAARVRHHQRFSASQLDCRQNHAVWPRGLRAKWHRLRLRSGRTRLRHRMGSVPGVRHGQCAISGGRRETLVLAENETRLSRRRLPLMRDALQETLSEAGRRFFSTDSRKQFAPAISETQSVFRGDRSRPRRFQRLRACCARPRRCAHITRFDGCPGGSVLAKTSGQSASHQAIRFAMRGRSLA